MSKKPESRLIEKVHRRLTSVHYEKNNNPYLHGLADCFYSGVRARLWVEYKQLDAADYRRMTKRLPLDLLSIHQRVWLYGRWLEGCNVGVFVGLKGQQQGLWFPDATWMLFAPTLADYPEPVTIDTFADTLADITGASPCRSYDLYSTFLEG